MTDDSQHDGVTRGTTVEEHQQQQQQKHNAVTALHSIAGYSTEEPDTTPGWDHIASCPTDSQCNKLIGDCINCDFNNNCIFGKPTNVTCRPKTGVECTVSILSL